MGLFPKSALEYAALADIPIGPNSKIYVVDPQTGHGSDSNPGTSFKAPLATLNAAVAKCTANHDDVVVLVPGPTGNALTAAITWPAYTHLIGIGAPVEFGQRCRVTGSTALDLATMITFGAGCIVRGVCFQNGSDAAAIKTAVTVSADYGYFENCKFELTNATALGTSGSHALALSGSDNTFKNCCFGNDTVLKAATNVVGALSLTGGAGRNLFQHCRFLSWSETAGSFLVTEATGAGGVARWNEYEDCVFQNFWSDHTGTLANAFDLLTVAGATTYGVTLRGQNNILVGVDGWADVVTWVTAGNVGGAGTYGVVVAPTT